MTKSSEYKTLSTEYTSIMLYIIAQIIIFREKVHNRSEIIPKMSNICSQYAKFTIKSSQ